MTDASKGYTLHVRNNVLAVTDTLPHNPDISLTLDLDTYKSIVNGTQKVVDAVKAGKVKLVGDEKDLENFVAMFDPLFVNASVGKPD